MRKNNKLYGVYWELLRTMGYVVNNRIQSNDNKEIPELKLRFYKEMTKKVGIITKKQFLRDLDEAVDNAQLDELLQESYVDQRDYEG